MKVKSMLIFGLLTILLIISLVGCKNQSEDIDNSKSSIQKESGDTEKSTEDKKEDEILNEIQKRVLSIEIEDLPKTFPSDDMYGVVTVESFQITGTGDIPGEENNYAVKAKIVANVKDKTSDYLAFTIDFYDSDDFKIGNYVFLEVTENSSTVKVEITFRVPDDTVRIEFGEW